MAASAFAALSQINGFQADQEADQQDEQDQLDHPKLDAVDSVQADAQTEEHFASRANSPPADDTLDTPASQNKHEEEQQKGGVSHGQPVPLTEGSLKTLASSTAEERTGVCAADTSPGQEGLQYPEPPTASLEQGRAGSTAGSQTFDSELHDSVSALVKAPGNTEQSQHSASGAADPTVDALIMQSLKEDVTSPGSGATFDAALQDGVSAAVTTGATTEQGTTSSPVCIFRQTHCESAELAMLQIASRFSTDTIVFGPIFTKNQRKPDQASSRHACLHSWSTSHTFSCACC